MQNDPSNPSATVSRRQFLKRSSIAVASAAAVVNFPAVLSAQANMKFNAIIIGVGGRGSDARLSSDRNWKMQDPQLPKSIWYLTDAKIVGFRIVRPLQVPTAEELAKYWTSGVEKE